ncbi:MAG: DUF1801 domain-containing protein [Prolixibacteraceae bacterium]|jgi:hypothetical protein
MKSAHNFSYPSSAAAVVFGGYLSARAAFRLDRKSPANGNFSYRQTLVVRRPLNPTNNILQIKLNTEIKAYNDKQTTVDTEICNLLATTVDRELSEAESKIWHAHPVWFLNGNPIVGYSKQKAGWRLIFWSGAGFDEEKLNVVGQKFKDASVFYTTIEQIDTNDLKRWLKKSREIQWDYKNIVKRKGQLERLK